MSFRVGEVNFDKKAGGVDFGTDQTDYKRKIRPEEIDVGGAFKTAFAAVNARLDSIAASGADGSAGDCTSVTGLGD